MLREAARQDVPAEVAVVRCRRRQRIRIASQDLVADRRQAFAKNLADVWMPAGTADDLLHRVLVDVADRELIEVGREAAARFDFTLGVDDRRPAGTFAV